MKNLEKEYKNHIEDSVPDLWSRIDEELDKLSVASEPAKVVPFYKKKNFRIAGELIAVAACALIVVSVFPMFPQKDLSNITSTEDSAPMATEHTFDSIFNNGAYVEESVNASDSSSGSFEEDAEATYNPSEIVNADEYYDYSLEEKFESAYNRKEYADSELPSLETPSGSENGVTTSDTVYGGMIVYDEYTTLPDGTYEYSGYSFTFLLELTGYSGSKYYAYTVLSLSDELSFEDVHDCMLSGNRESSLPDFIVVKEIFSSDPLQ